eukprot:Gb_30655 [translate_table: standard]
MRIVTARSPSPSPSSSPSPSYSKRISPSKRWRRVDCVITFPSSKRVQRTPNANHSSAYSHHHRSPQHHSVGATSHTRHHPSSNSHKRTTQGHGANSHSPIIKAKPSVWVRVSDKSANGNSIHCDDFEVHAAATKKIVPIDLSDDISKRSDEVQHDSAVSEMDIDQKGIVDEAKSVMEDNEEYRIVDVSHKFTIRPPTSATKEKPLETDAHKVSQRQKQIDYGKNTLGYEQYVELVPRNQRKRCHPQTPDIKQVCSKRSWDGQVKKWRRLLHEFDPPVNEDDENPELFSVGGANDSMAKENNIENQESRGASSASESNTTREGEVSAIYDDWDAMEP